MNADLRIRLEGKVEKLEAAVFAWEAAAASLLAERWRAPGRWKSLLQASPALPVLEAAIDAKAPADPDVAALSARLREAREQVRVRGEQRLRELSVAVPPAPSLDTVLGLLTQPPKVHFRSGPGPRGLIIELGAAFGITAWVLLTRESRFTLAALLTALVIVAAFRRLMGSKVILTDAGFAADRDSCSLDEVNRVYWKLWVSPVNGAAGRQFVFELNRRPAFSVFVAERSDQLLEALVRCGVRCEPQD